MIESYRSAVSLAECDEMGHMNIEHYAARAEAAGAVLAALEGRSVPEPAMLHLRFHRELLAGDRIAVRTARLADQGSPRLQHLIENAGTRLLAATCLAAYDGVAPAAPEGAPTAEAMPRSVTGGWNAEAATAPRVTHLAPIAAADTGPGGTMTLPAFLARISRCQAHLWALAGLDRRAQAQAGLGTASLELRAQRHVPARPGRVLRIVTSFMPPAGKTLHYRHEASDAASGTALFTATGVGAVIDLGRRRAVPWPAPSSQFA